MLGFCAVPFRTKMQLLLSRLAIWNRYCNQYWKKSIIKNTKRSFPSLECNSPTGCLTFWVWGVTLVIAFVLTVYTFVFLDLYMTYKPQHVLTKSVQILGSHSWKWRRFRISITGEHYILISNVSVSKGWVTLKAPKACFLNQLLTMSDD